MDPKQQAVYYEDTHRKDPPICRNSQVVLGA